MMQSCNFDIFCKRMHRENCQERKGFGEEPLEFDDYITNNEAFLKSLYAEEQALYAKETDPFIYE